MPSCVYAIVGGDYANGGIASRSVKEQLKKIGADPAAIRRAMIAAYEAEMNVVIHAYRGRMKTSLSGGRLDIEVVDEGPGIPDIELALKEGYSTAPPGARELGFGAGMGLPNIKKNSDSFEIDSVVGIGTSVSFSINLAPAQAAAIGANSILTIAEKCRGCMDCLRTCPTKALRIREGKPVILDYLCIDCTNCIGFCDSNAVTVLGTTDKVEVSENSVIVIPSAVLAQFGTSIGITQFIKLLKEIGFGEIRFLEYWDNALRAAVIDHAQHEAKRWPVISPICPAAINLIRTRFPSLIENVAPFYPPLYSIGKDIGEREAVYVTMCPSQRTLLASNRLLNKSKIILPSALRAAIMPLLKGKHQQDGQSQSIGSFSEKTNEQKILRVAGMRHVMKMMEEIEDGQINDAAVVEMYACDHGCFGSPLLAENPFVAEYRWRQMQFPENISAKAIKRRESLTVRQGMRLDEDMSKAIEKLKQIEEHIRTLPGRDCSICGAPSCAAMAEDIVLGRTKKSECVFFRD